MTRRSVRGLDDDAFLIVTQYFPPEPGAAQVRLGALASTLRRLGHRVDVVTAIPNYPLGRFFDGWSHRPVQHAHESGVSVTRVWVFASMGGGAKRVLNYMTFGAMSAVGILSRRGRPRRLIVEYPTLFGALPAVVWGRTTGREVNLLVADLWVESITAFGLLGNRTIALVLRWLERWMLGQCHTVSVVTEGVRDAVLAKSVPPSKVIWLPNGVDTEMFAPDTEATSLTERLGVDPGVHVIVYAGTHGFVHGLDVALDAAALLRDEPVHLLLVGDGSEKARLVARAAEAGLANVTFWDPVPPDQVAGIIAGSAAGLATVRAGDLYRVIRSAKIFPVMACGRPVIYSGDDEGSRIVAGADAGLATTPGDAEALADAIRQLLASPRRRAEMGANGRAWVEDHASWDLLVSEWLTSRRSVVAGAEGARRGDRGGSA